MAAGALMGAGAVALFYDPAPIQQSPNQEQAGPAVAAVAPVRWRVVYANSLDAKAFSPLMLTIRAEHEFVKDRFDRALWLIRKARASWEDLPPTDQHAVAWQIYSLKIEARILEKMGRIHEVEGVRRETVQRLIAYYLSYEREARVSKGVKISVEDLGIRNGPTAIFSVPERSLDGRPFPVDDGIPRLRMCTNELLDAVICRSGEG